jgi:heme ABC exporter ATP-binding subunit CcmA
VGELAEAERPTETTSAAGHADSAIELDRLSREYGERIALREVSLVLARGETLVVLGPNGAGKTTLLRVLATLLRPSAGSASVLGCELPRQAWRLRGRLGYLGHEPLLYRDLTVEENLRFHARLHGLDVSGSQRIAQLLGLVGMERRSDELVRNLSAGMAQRVAVCRAVLHEPELLLLDEPLAHLDPRAAALVEPLIGRGGDSTRVVVTHDPERGLEQGERALALTHHGSVAYEGPVAGLSAGEARAIYEGGTE